MTEDEIVGWHHWFNGHEFEQAPEISDGQGSLVCCSPWGHKELDMRDWTELNWWCLGVIYLCSPPMLLVTTKYIHLFSVHLGAIFQCWPLSWLCSLQIIISSLTCKRNLIRFSGLEILNIYIWMDLVALLIIYLYSVCKHTWWDLPMPLSYRTHSSFSLFLSFQFFLPSLSPTVTIFFFFFYL